MGIKIARIENTTSRQATFAKRRRGLLKKAHDLCVLCDAEVAVILFSSKGKLFEYASPNMQSILERYLKCSDAAGSVNKHHLLDEQAGHKVSRCVEALKSWQRNFMDEDLERLSLSDLINLERQTYDDLDRVRSKKGALLIEELEDINKKVLDASRTTNASSTFLAELVDSFSSDGAGSGSHNSMNNGICTVQNIPQHHQTIAIQVEALTSQTGVGASELESLKTSACNEVRWPVIFEDLNCSPRCTE